MQKLIIVALLGIASPALAEDGAAILQKDCVSCHNLAGPAPQTLKELWNIKGPNLAYAGNKYRKEWLVRWLQAPRQIRPAGEFYGNHIKIGDKHDEVDASTLKPHMALSKSDAVAVAAELMKLKQHDDLIAKEKIVPGKGTKMMDEMMFDKFLGCMACHQIEPDFGGMSGPEVYTAAERLQPEFIASFIRSPQAWEPKTWMPNKHVSDSSIQKLGYYFEEIATGASNAK
jgi:cytochrome c551/c552